MSMKIKAIYLYLGFIFWILLLALLLRLSTFNVTGLGITLAFLTLVFAPGIFLWRLSRQKTENWSLKTLYIIGLGFAFYFFLNLLAIFLNLTLIQLIWLSSAFLFIIYALSFWFDRKEELEISLQVFKTKALVDWLLLALVAVAAIVSFFVIDAQSDKLIGDGWFHLAILQKITSGVGLNPSNLWVIKTASLNPVYSFPIWHILVGYLAQILDIPIFTALKQILLPLSILAMLSWYALAKVIFKNHYLTVIAFLAFLLVFLKDNSFYYLIAISSPDSFNRLLLLPVILGMIIVFIFNQNSSRVFNLVLISLLAIFLGLIHFTQLIYLVLILIVLGILLVIFSRDKLLLLKLASLIGGLAVLIIPYLLLQYSAVASFLKGQAANFTQDKITFKTYLGANIIYRYAILSLPLMALFVKKQAHLLILLAIALVALLIYWPYFGLRPTFLKYLGEIFVTRSLANVPHFLYFGFLLFMIIYGLNYLFSKNQTLKWITNVFFGLLFVIGLVSFSFRTLMAEAVENYLFSETFPGLIIGFWPILMIIILICLAIYFILAQKSLEIPEPKDRLNFALMTIFVFFFLATPYFGNMGKIFRQSHQETVLSPRLSTNASDISYFGGLQTIQFWQQNSPKVYLTDVVTLGQMVLLYSPNFLAEYPYGITNFSYSQDFYDDNLSLKKRLQMLEQWQVDFIIVRHNEELPFYQNNPQYFQLVFENHYFYEKPRDLYIFQYLR